VSPIRVLRASAVLLASALCFGALPAHASPPLTKNCDTDFSYGLVEVFFPNPTIAQEFVALVANPARDPQLYHRIWEPKEVRLMGIDWGVFSYDANQDAEEIAQALVADPMLHPASIQLAVPDFNFGSAAVGIPVPMRLVTITEYYNRPLDHYFLSSSEEENRIIDTGGAGPGWERTGETFQSSVADSGYNAKRVFRFYNPAANSHFFTADAGECGSVRSSDPGWQIEGDAFGASLPVNGACPARSQAVYRLYNNRWMHNDSNHRYVTRVELYNDMQARGWIGEGITMCTVTQ